METGVNKPAHSLFDLRALESHSEKECHLSIQIGLNGFSFCIRNSSEILGIECYNSPLSQLESTIEASEWITKDYASINTTINTKKSTLIPAALYQVKDKKKYLEFNHRRTENLEVIADEIRHIDSYAVYGISKAEQDIISTFFPKSTIKHFSTAHISNLMRFNKNETEKKMFVNISHKQMDITIIDQNNLVYFNIFNHKSNQDCVYYILYVCEQLKLNPEHLKLMFMGNVNKDSKIFRLAYTYIRSINFSERFVKLSPAIDNIEKHQHYTLLHQHLCE